VTGRAALASGTHANSIPAEAPVSRCLGGSPACADAGYFAGPGFRVATEFLPHRREDFSGAGVLMPRAETLAQRCGENIGGDGLSERVWLYRATRRGRARLIPGVSSATLPLPGLRKGCPLSRSFCDRFTQADFAIVIVGAMPGFCSVSPNKQQRKCNGCAVHLNRGSRSWCVRTIFGPAGLNVCGWGFTCSVPAFHRAICLLLLGRRTVVGRI
jgi:hypothetical protein